LPTIRLPADQLFIQANDRLASPKLLYDTNIANIDRRVRALDGFIHQRTDTNVSPIIIGKRQECVRRAINTTA